MKDLSFDFKNLKTIENSIKPEIDSFDPLGRKKKELEELSTEVLFRIIELISDVNESNIEKKFVLDESNRIINEILFESKRSLSFRDKQIVATYVMDEIFGYGPITSLIADPTVTEIMVNGVNDVFIERSGKIFKVENSFRDNNHIMHTIDKIISPLGRRVDESSPMVDARLPDGSRVNIIIPPLENFHLFSYLMVI